LRIWARLARYRTTPLEELQKPIEGLNLFYTDLDRAHVEVREIEKLGRKCVDANQLFIDVHGILTCPVSASR
jgi:hypothetical protein